MQYMKKHSCCYGSQAKH